MLRVFVVDDHDLVRAGLRQVLEEVPDMMVAGEAASSAAALEAIRGRKPDVVVLDLSLPDRGGLDLLKELKRLDPALPVLVLSVHPEEQYALRALKAGASGYVTKNRAAKELIEALGRIAEGGKYITASIAERLTAQLSASRDSAPHETLSDREYEILCLIASGLAVGQIAERLSLSVKTVSTYRARLLQKMGLKTNAELTRYAFQNRLVE